MTQAHPRGGRHPPRAGRSLPGAVSIELRLSAAQSLSCHSTLPHRCPGRTSRPVLTLRLSEPSPTTRARNRHCPKCQAQAREPLVGGTGTRAPRAPATFHVVFTVPHELNPLALENPISLLRPVVHRQRFQTVLEIAADPETPGSGDRASSSTLPHLGIAQNLLLHPHIHCVIPAGGLALDHRRWLRPRYRFLLTREGPPAVFSAAEFLAGFETTSWPQETALCPGPLPLLPTPSRSRNSSAACIATTGSSMPEARFRWSPAGVALSRSLHPPRGHFQSSFVGLRSGPG